VCSGALPHAPPATVLIQHRALQHASISPRISAEGTKKRPDPILTYLRSFTPQASPSISRPMPCTPQTRVHRNCICLSSISGCKAAAPKVHRPELTCAQQTPTLQTGLPCWYVHRTAGRLSGLAKLACSPPSTTSNQHHHGTTQALVYHHTQSIIELDQCHAGTAAPAFAHSLHVCSTQQQGGHSASTPRCTYAAACRKQAGPIYADTNTLLPLLQPYAAGSHAMQFS
jgi:hypothetical protein